MFCKNIQRCSGNMLRGLLQDCWESFLQKHWKMFCQDTDTCSAKILGGVLEKCG